MRDVYSIPMVCPPKIFGHAAQILGGFRSWLSKSLGKLIIIKTKRYKFHAKTVLIRLLDVAMSET